MLHINLKTIRVLTTKIIALACKIRWTQGHILVALLTIAVELVIEHQNQWSPVGFFEWTRSRESDKEPAHKRNTRMSATDQDWKDENLSMLPAVSANR